MMLARSPLRRLYDACGALAALFLIAIAVLILTSIAVRLMGTTIQGLADYAGYCMAAGSFLALAYTFTHGGHIRVTLILQRFKGGSRRAAELWCLTAAAGLAGYFAYYSIRFVIDSYTYTFISEGPDATPLWIPQIGMGLGTTVLAIAIVDRLIQVARGADLDDPDPGLEPGH